MKRKLNCILLIDDNDADNDYHQIIISEMNVTDNIQVVENGEQAIVFLKKENQIIPDLIFLDINMPRMNGWEFLEEYKNLDVAQRAKIVIVMLTTSANPDDVIRAETIAEVNGFKSKPLSEDMLNEILEQHFSDNA